MSVMSFLWLLRMEEQNNKIASCRLQCRENVDF